MPKPPHVPGSIHEFQSDGAPGLGQLCLTCGMPKATTAHAHEADPETSDSSTCVCGLPNDRHPDWMGHHG